MDSESGLLRAVLPPLVLVTFGAVLIGIATIVDHTPAHEWSLTIGAPSILILIGGLIWLVVAVLIWYFNRRHGRS